MLSLLFLLVPPLPFNVMVIPVTSMQRVILPLAVPVEPLIQQAPVQILPTSLNQHPNSPFSNSLKFNSTVEAQGLRPEIHPPGFAPHPNSRTIPIYCFLAGWGCRKGLLGCPIRNVTVNTLSDTERSFPNASFP